MIKAPILFSESENGPAYTSLFGLFKTKNNLKHPKIIEIQGFLKKLKDLDSLKGLKAAKANSDKEKILIKLSKGLSHTETSQKTFLY